MTSLFASLIWAVGGSLLLNLAFCFFRPRTNAVYAPRAKHADEKHAPPRLGRGFFAWVAPIKDVKESRMVDMVGLDAVIFLRFLRMLRNMFLVLSVLGLAILLPLLLAGGHTVQSVSKRQTSGADPNSTLDQVAWLMRLTPQYTFGPVFWGYTAIAYIFSAVVCFFIWWNYRAVLRLRRNYLTSPEYLSSLHARTLMVCWPSLELYIVLTNTLIKDHSCPSVDENRRRTHKAHGRDKRYS